MRNVAQNVQQLTISKFLFDFLRIPFQLCEVHGTGFWPRLGMHLGLHNILHGPTTAVGKSNIPRWENEATHESYCSFITRAYIPVFHSRILLDI